MEQEPRAVAETDDAQRYAHMGPGLWLLRVLHGALIGAGAILPGISGGVLCVMFGIYRPMMALLAHPFRTFRIYYSLFIPVILGWAVGFFALAGAVNLLWQDLLNDNGTPKSKEEITAIMAEHGVEPNDDFVVY